MIKMQKLARLLYFCLAILVFGSCEETKYILPPEVKIQTPEFGLSVALGESVDISAEVSNVSEDAQYQWSVNGIKVSTARTLHFEGIEPGNNTVKLSVTTENGTGTDAVNILVARGEIDASISVVGNREPEIEYLDSLVLRGNVFCREDYEVEWIVDDERVSKESYYVFKALKEGIHTVTFKALDVNGKFVTAEIDIKVNVPVLDAIIEEPEFGFRTPMGEPLTLHGEANRVGDIAWEWSINGEVVGNEQDYTLPADNLDLVEVTLKVTDPTQTASSKVTVDVHNATQYGTYIVSKKDIHFVDYAGRITKNVYTAANPDVDIDDIDFSGTSDYNDKYLVYQADQNFVMGDDRLFTTDFVFDIIDLKTLHIIKSLKISIKGEANNFTSDGKVAIVNENLFYTAKMWDDTGDPDAIYMIDINTGDKKMVYSLQDKTVAALFSHNGHVYFCSSNELTAIDGTTGEVIYTKPKQSSISNMSKRETYTVADNKLYRFQSNSSYVICYDLLTGDFTRFLNTKDSPRLYLRNMCVYNDYIYACNDGFLGRMPVNSDETRRPFTYLADLNSNNQYGSGYVLNENKENLKIMPDGIMFVRWQGSTSYQTIVGIYSIKDPATMISQLETPRQDYIYQFIYRE